MTESVEPPGLAPDGVEPATVRQFAAVLAVDLGPRLVIRCLGLEDEPVEVEDERLDLAPGWQCPEAYRTRRFKISDLARCVITADGGIGPAEVAHVDMSSDVSPRSSAMP